MMLKILVLSALVVAASGVSCNVNQHGTGSACTNCAAGKLNAAGDLDSATTTCDDCTATQGDTAGTCITGCPLNYYQGTVKGSSNVDITCGACAPGYLLAPAAPDANPTTCSTKCNTGTTGGHCKTGCPVNSYQATGTTAADIQCIACAAGKTTPAAAIKSAVVTVSVCVAATNQHADKCSTPSTAKNSDLSGHEDEFACTTANTAKGYTLVNGGTSASTSSAVPCLTACTHCAAGYFQTARAFTSKAACQRCAAGYTIATAIVGSAATTCTVAPTTSGAAFVPTGLAVVMAMVVAAVAI